MARDRNNVIKRSDEDGWQDFKDGANKNKEDGIEIKEKKKEESCSFPAKLRKREGLRWKRPARTARQFLRRFHVRTEIPPLKGGEAAADKVRISSWKIIIKKKVQEAE